MNTDKNKTDKRGFRQTGLEFTFADFVTCAIAKHNSRPKYSDLLNFLFLSVFIRGCNRICQSTSRMLYMTSTCRRPFWNLRDGKIESLAPAACCNFHGDHDPLTEISAGPRRFHVHRES